MYLAAHTVIRSHRNNCNEVYVRLFSPKSYASSRYLELLYRNRRITYLVKQYKNNHFVHINELESCSWGQLIDSRDLWITIPDKFFLKGRVLWLGFWIICQIRKSKRKVMNGRCWVGKVGRCMDFPSVNGHSFSQFMTIRYLVDHDPPKYLWECNQYYSTL